MRPIFRRARFDRPLLLSAGAVVLLGLAVAAAGLYAIPLGLGDKTVLHLFGLTLERRSTYQGGVMLAAVGALMLLAGFAIPRDWSLRILRPTLAATVAGVVALTWARGEMTLSAHPVDAAAGDAAVYYTMPDTPYSDPKRAAELIRFATAPAAEALRGRLVQRLWPGTGLPAGRGFDRVERAVEAPDLMAAGAARVDRLHLSLPHGFTAIGLHAVPQAAPTGRLVIYAHGHVGGLEAPAAVEAIGRLLAAGHAVTAFAMPNRPPNLTPPVLETSTHGLIANTQDHEGFAPLETDTFSPVRLFIAPLVAAVDHALTEGFRDVAAVGLSGGGWTVTVAAAVDPRIRASYPVAGSLPLHLQALPPNRFGDWEQTQADIYRIATYPELYVLGAAGAGRRQVQILNQFDSCCFRGIGARGYAPAVSAAVDTLGGHWALEILPEHDHRISPEAFALILADLQGTPAP